MDIDSFMIHFKIQDFYKNIPTDVEQWFNTSNYNEDEKRSLPIDH